MELPWTPPDLPGTPRGPFLIPRDPPGAPILRVFDMVKCKNKLPYHLASDFEGRSLGGGSPPQTPPFHTVKCERKLPYHLDIAFEGRSLGGFAPPRPPPFIR